MAGIIGVVQPALAVAPLYASCFFVDSSLQQFSLAVPILLLGELACHVLRDSAGLVHADLDDERTSTLMERVAPADLVSWIE